MGAIPQRNNYRSGRTGPASSASGNARSGPASFSKERETDRGELDTALIFLDYLCLINLHICMIILIVQNQVF